MYNLVHLLAQETEPLEHHNYENTCSIYHKTIKLSFNKKKTNYILQLATNTTMQSEIKLIFTYILTTVVFQKVKKVEKMLLFVGFNLFPTCPQG